MDILRISPNQIGFYSQGRNCLVENLRSSVALVLSDVSNNRAISRIENTLLKDSQKEKRVKEISEMKKVLDKSINVFKQNSLLPIHAFLIATPYIQIGSRQINPACEYIKTFLEEGEIHLAGTDLRLNTFSYPVYTLDVVLNATGIRIIYKDKNIRFSGQDCINQIIFS